MRGISGTNDFYSRNSHAADYIKYPDTPANPFDPARNLETLSYNKAAGLISSETKIV